MASSEKINIVGYNNQPVPHTFFRQESATNHLAIMLPGRGYSADLPLFFYPFQLLQSTGADILRVDYDTYTRHSDFQALPMDEQLRWLMADVASAMQTGMSQREYQKVTLVGKSLGTLAMGHLLSTQTLPAHVKAIWLTPLVRFDFLREQMKTFNGDSLFVIGTADSHYDADALAEIQQATNGQVVAIEDADHGMNIANNVHASVQALAQIMQAVDTFLAQ